MDSLARIRTASTVAIAGFGREARSFLAFCSREGIRFRAVVYDDRTIPQEDLEAIAGGPLVQGEAARAGDLKPDVVFRSPGVSPYHHPVLRALSGVPVVTSVNLWFARYSPAGTIVITGTKGKSTTASLLHAGLKALGRDVLLAGNIGVPLLDCEPGRDESVLELSSYQVADMTVSPHLGVVINLYPEHVDWHGSHERYYADKLRLVSELAPHHALINGADERIASRLNGVGGLHRFGTPDGYHVRDGALWHRSRRVAIQPILRGEHNLANIAAVLEALHVLGHLDADAGEPRAVLDALERVGPLAHRLEEIGTWQGRLYVDDSISTTPESTLAALRVYRGRPVTLLLGGHDRAQDYRMLGKQIGGLTVTAVLGLPGNGARALEQVREGVGGADAPAMEACASLDAAMERARAFTPEGGVVLLSPGAPSYGSFRDFQARGEAFRRLALRDGEGAA